MRPSSVYCQDYLILGCVQVLFAHGLSFLSRSGCCQAILKFRLFPDSDYEQASFVSGLGLLLRLGLLSDLGCYEALFILKLMVRLHELMIPGSHEFRVGIS